jgi:hypothetical protein
MTVFEWDEDKRLSNLRKHGIDFRDVYKIFEGRHYSGKSKNRGSDEERFIAIGELNGSITSVIYTVRGEAIRVISIRKARHAEKKTYDQEKSANHALYH